MIANVHDIVLTIGFMSISQVDFDLTSIAALLTILGYSLNDTVVIYDRIREMLRRYKKMPMPQLLNESINSTLSRSIITHVTVTLALLALLLVRRPRHPQLHGRHDVRRRAGRHLHLDLHRAPILIYLGVGEHRDAPERPAKKPACGCMRVLSTSASSEVGADRGLRQGRFAFADMSHRGSLLCLPRLDLGLDVHQARADSTLLAGRRFRCANDTTPDLGTG
jgi:hypothetical protein